jgi:DNA-binding CsgD family transcriptional regulator
MVGRDAEALALQHAFARACAGHGGAIAVVGEAGIGKTTLARSLLAHARGAGAYIALGRCRDEAAAVAFAPLTEALASLLRSAGAHRVVQWLGPHAPSMGAILPELNASLPDPDAARTLPAREQRVRQGVALAQMVGNGEPTLLVLEDLHWADADSLDLLARVAPALSDSRWLLVLTCREEGAGEALLHALDSLRRDGGLQRVALHGLAAEPAAMLVRALSGRAVSPPLLVGLLAETGGNPFYLGELTRHLCEEHAQVWQQALDITACGIPQGVRAVLPRRLARLSPPARQLLSVAAAFVHEQRAEIAAEVAGLPEAIWLAALDEVIAAGLMRADGAASMEFSHVIVRRAVNASENPERRVRLHRQIALALERAAPRRDTCAELAAQYHASAALPGAERGLPHALAAAAQAAEAGAHDATLRFLSMAVQLAEQASPGERAEAWGRLAQAEAQAMRFDAARHSIEQALAAVDARLDDASLGDAQGESAAVAAQKVALLDSVAREMKGCGAPPSAWQALVQRGLDLTGDQRKLAWARLHLLQDRVNPLPGGPPYAGRWTGFDPQAVAIARHSGDEEAWAATVTPYDFRSAEETGELLARARRCRRPAAILRGLDAAARDLLHRRCDYREAEAVLQEMLWVAERFGAIAGQAEALYGLAKCQALRGDLALARATAARVPPLVARLGDVHRLQLMSRTALHIEIDYLGGGDWARLAADAWAFVQRPQSRTSPLALLNAAFAACAFAHTGELGRAALATRAVLDLAPRGARRDYMNQAAIDIAATAAWHGRLVDLAAPLWQLLQQSDPAAGTAPIGCVELQCARMASLSGQAEPAREAFDAARRVLDARGFVGAIGIADIDEARHLQGTDADAAIALAERAEQRFDMLGMAPWQERAHALLAQLEPLRYPPRPPFAAAQGAPAGEASAPTRAGSAQAGASDTAPLPAGLTAREAQVLRLLAAGRSSKRIARELALSPATVNRHVANVYAKIGAANRADATRFAVGHGLVALSGPPVADGPADRSA